jgi:hypothetical protein
MPVDCPYYREYRRGLRKDESPADGALVWVTVPYCLHKHSPAPLDRIANLPQAWKILLCGGTVDHCQIPVGERLDI